MSTYRSLSVHSTFGRSISEKIPTQTKHVNTPTHGNIVNSDVMACKELYFTIIAFKIPEQIHRLNPPRFWPCGLYHPQCHYCWRSTIRLHFRSMCDPPLPNHTTWLTINSEFPTREVKAEASHSPLWERASEGNIHMVKLHILEHWSLPGSFYSPIMKFLRCKFSLPLHNRPHSHR